MPAVKVDVDVSSIQLAIDLASTQTRGSMDKLLGYTAYYTAVRAQKYLPAADIATIDAELSETVQVGKSASNQMTMGQAIVLARMNPNSRFNQMTSNRWAMQRPSLSAANFQRAYGDGGMAKSVLWEFINNAEERMQAARHSSTHFLKSGWKAVKQKIKAAGFRISGNSLGVTETSDSNNSNRLPIDLLGDAQAGGQGTNSSWITIENKVGTDATFPRLAAEHNAALMDYGVPALQQALDEQAQWMRDKYFPRAENEIAAAWNSVPDAGAFVPGTHTRAVAAAEDEALAEAGGELVAFT